MRLVYIVLSALLALAGAAYWATRSPFAATSTSVVEDAYDYVIVGAGSAGCVLAARLSEDPKVTVLLLEAGGPGTGFFVDIPSAANRLQRTELDWQYKTTPQKRAFGSMVDRRGAVPRGKGLGGSSLLNYMQWVRPFADGADEWKVPGWSYEEVLPYILKSEDAECCPNDPKHGHGGPVTVSNLVPSSDLAMRFVNACVADGLPLVDTSLATVGCGLSRVSTRGGRRWSTAKAYLAPALHRPNLVVASGALVHRVRLNERGEAIGVDFERHGHNRTVLALREVVLSAGAIGTPQILLLSGIGPRPHLESLGIPVHADLPVGDNLQDHIMTPLLFDSPVTPTLHEAKITVLQLLHFLWTGTGPLTSTGALEALAFFQTGLRPDLGAAPDVQLHVVLGTPTIRDHLNANFVQSLFHPHDSVLMVLPTLLHPRSTGTVRLQSANPHDPPLIDPNYFEDELDVRVLAAGVRRALRMMQHEGLAARNITLSLRQFAAYPPPPRNGSEVELQAWAERLVLDASITVYHHCCTAKMGPEGDPAAVVDPRLRVRGVPRLRVADASIMPSVVGANTNAPVIMIAERAVDLIREDAVLPLRETTGAPVP